VSIEDPTLKVRIVLPDLVFLGSDCHSVAARLIAGEYPEARAVDSKWSRPESKWIADGRGWGRQRLKDEEKGFVAAVNALCDEGSVEARLVAIIKRLTS
jgi:hypothetical protein